MKFWETMTIKEMELLLKRRKEPGIQEGWNELAQKIDNDRYPNRDRFYSLERQILSSCPMVPAAYFFFCVAVSVQQNCETAPDLREVTLARNEIAKMAARDLPEFCTKTGAMSVLRPVFVGEPPYSIPVFPINMALRELFNALAEDNRKRWEKGLELQAEDDQKKLTAEHGAQKNLEYGLDNLERELNQWDNTCRSMWETALAAQEEPPSQDAPPEEPAEDGVRTAAGGKRDIPGGVSADSGGGAANHLYRRARHRQDLHCRAAGGEHGHGLDAAGILGKAEG